MQLRCKEGDLVEQAAGVARISRDHGQQSASRFFALAQLGKSQGVGGAMRQRHREALAALEFGKIHSG